ncbi:hypothetical protein C8J57DRAFT_1282661 [Mycena rebaudengoi]|nr:hypothetical protein C8J57DRAFT_1282661 [Mycena rebaudengoi]
MSASSSEAISLQFQDLVRVAGEIIQGRVDLNVALAQEDNIEHLRIKLRGSIHTTITVSNGQSSTTHKQTISLIRQDKALWVMGAAFPEPGSHILACPFEFHLPEGLPPSFHCSAHRRTAAISYSLEVVGDRPGLFQFNRRIRRLISVVPAASQNQLLAKESFRQGFAGRWRTLGRDEKLRQGIWGDYSYAQAELMIPDTPSFPIATEVPFSFHVITRTKPMSRSERPEDKHGKPLFPAPPTLSSDIKFMLVRDTNIRVRSRARHVNDQFKLKGSLGDVTRVAAVRAIADEPEWIPDPGEKYEKNRGIWKRAIHFETAVALPYAPSYMTETVDWAYQLRFEVPFPGIGNDLTFNVPIHLDPASACPPPPFGAAGSSRMTYADVLPAGPPPPMDDLPPLYWSGDNHDWDDEKK